MRICYISTYPPTECGIATYTKYLSDEILKLKRETFVLCQVGSYGEIAYPTFSPSDNDISHKLFHMASKFTPDIIHIQHEFGLFGEERGIQIIDFLLRCKIADIPVVTTLHTVYKPPARKERIITEQLLEYSSEIIVHEHYQKEYILDFYKYKKQVHVIPHGVRRSNKIIDAKKLLDVEGKKVILLAGYFRTTKHFEKIVEYFPEIIKRCKDAVLIVACRLRILEYNKKRDQLLEKINSIDYPENIRILKGQFPQYTLDTIMSAADVVVMPYSAGAQSGMLAQFSAFNIPVVSSDLESFQVWTNETGGGFTSHHDIDYIENICKILSNNELADEMCQKIKTDNNKRYWDVISKQHLQIYEDLVINGDKVSKFFYIPTPENY